jgi:large subunit ribosomal protein L17
MRHLKHTAKLGRNCGHRKAMLVNLACSLIEHDQIKTTVSRAKELRRVVDKLITHAKKGGLHQRRLVIADLQVNTPSDKEQTKKAVVEKLFGDLAKRFELRKGGYTRIIRLGTRIGDAAERCMIQFVEEGAPVSKKKSSKKADAAPKAEEAKA